MTSGIDVDEQFPEVRKLIGMLLWRVQKNDSVDVPDIGKTRVSKYIIN